MPHVPTVSFEDAFALLPHAPVVVTAMAAAEPQGFFSRLHERLPALGHAVIHCANPNRDYPCFASAAGAGAGAGAGTGEGEDPVEFRAQFLTSAVRGRVREARVQYVPQHLSQWSRNIRARGPVDVFWGTCSLPDANGTVSLGTGACYESEMARHARIVILEINGNAPRTHGATLLPASAVTAFVRNDVPLPTLAPCVPDAIDHAVAENVVRLVPDGATLQLGIGAIPNAVGRFLRAKRDLGVHTELVTESIVDLVESGAVTGARKSLWPARVVGAFVLGSQRLYDFVHENPMVELHPASLVNDPWIVGRNALMHSINTCVEMDVTGQVCSESLGHEEISGVGGAADTHVGAQRSEGGRGILAFRSRTPRGESKIVFELRPGAKVSISRNDVDTVVTEWGVAELRGRSVAERVEALVRVAHPEVRTELWEKALEVGYVGRAGRRAPTT